MVCPQKKKIIPYKITDEVDFRAEMVGMDQAPFIDFRVVASFKKDAEELIKATINRGKKFER